MLDMGWTEILVIGVVALIVVGPKDLPRMLRTLGQHTGKLRGMAREFQKSMDDAARDADMAEFKEINKSLNDVRAIGSDAAKAVQQGIKTVDKEMEAATDLKKAAATPSADPKPVKAPETPPEGVESTAAAEPAPEPAPEPVKQTGAGGA